MLNIKTFVCLQIYTVRIHNRRGSSYKKRLEVWVQRVLQDALGGLWEFLRFHLSK